MLINFVGINPIDALFRTAVINGVLAPPLLFVVMLIAHNRIVVAKIGTGPSRMLLVGSPWPLWARQRWPCLFTF